MSCSCRLHLNVEGATTIPEDMNIILADLHALRVPCTPLDNLGCTGFLCPPVTLFSTYTNSTSIGPLSPECKYITLLESVLTDALTCGWT